MSIEAGQLYIVATPIGNLEDMSQRAVQVLRAVDLIAAEDTRHSGVLLRHFSITTPMLALHDYNERQISEMVIGRLLEGKNVALISDAGTPLISDPGYHLARNAHHAGLRLVPVPGPSALIAALSVSGLPTDRFSFEGFLPAKHAARRKRLEGLVQERRTLAFYESPHRILDSLDDMVEILGPERDAVLARELTKTFETIRLMTLGELQNFVRDDPNQQKGEFVLLVAGAAEPERGTLDAESCRIASLLAEELPVKKASALAAKITGVKKNALYNYLIGKS